MEHAIWRPPAGGVTRGLCLLILLLMLAAVVYAGLITARYIGQIGV